MAYFQFENGAINEARLSSALGPLKGPLSEQYVQERWSDIKKNFVPAYQEHIDKVIEELNSKK